MHLSVIEGKRRMFTLILLIKSKKEVWVEELAREGYTRPTSRLYLGLLEDYRLVSGTWAMRDDSKGVRRVYKLTDRGHEVADLLLQLEKLLGEAKSKDLR